MCSLVVHTGYEGNDDDEEETESIIMLLGFFPNAFYMHILAWSIRKYMYANASFMQCNIGVEDAFEVVFPYTKNISHKKKHY